MVSSSSAAGWAFDLWEFIPVIAVLSFGIYRDRVRRKTLRRRDDGVYIWVEWHGGERSSRENPTEDWDSEGDGDGGGD